jgi:hypothetical protein
MLLGAWDETKEPWDFVHQKPPLVEEPAHCPVVTVTVGNSFAKILIVLFCPLTSVTGPPSPVPEVIARGIPANVVKEICFEADVVDLAILVNTALWLLEVTVTLIVPSVWLLIARLVGLTQSLLFFPQDHSCKKPTDKRTSESRFAKIFFMNESPLKEWTPRRFLTYLFSQDRLIGGRYFDFKMEI